MNGEFKGDDDAPSNKIYIRYADVILWKAEAMLKTGDTEGAIEAINQIRRRARNSITAAGTYAPAGTLPDRDLNESNVSVITSWLVQERRVELAFESHRFRDLKRWGIAGDVLGSRGFQDVHHLFPIPQREIDKSGGTIIQNEGY